MSYWNVAMVISVFRQNVSELNYHQQCQRAGFSVHHHFTEKPKKTTKLIFYDKSIFTWGFNICMICDWNWGGSIWARAAKCCGFDKSGIDIGSAGGGVGCAGVKPGVCGALFITLGLTAPTTNIEIRYNSKVILAESSNEWTKGILQESILDKAWPMKARKFDSCSLTNLFSLFKSSSLAFESDEN